MDSKLSGLNKDCSDKDPWLSEFLNRSNNSNIKLPLTLYLMDSTCLLTVSILIQIGF
jgi:hypothetical protein